MTLTFSLLCVVFSALAGYFGAQDKTFAAGIMLVLAGGCLYIMEAAA